MDSWSYWLQSSYDYPLLDLEAFAWSLFLRRHALVEDWFKSLPLKKNARIRKSDVRVTEDVSLIREAVRRFGDANGDPFLLRDLLGDEWQLCRWDYLLRAAGLLHWIDPYKADYVAAGLLAGWSGWGSVAGSSSFLVPALPGEWMEAGTLGVKPSAAAIDAALSWGRANGAPRDEVALIEALHNW
ncbi:hypothetical protein [Bifidobacterium olomucense]|uniref:hypothetical protein n=1 Tax=Bifidobacterium olomucense TaxID=2675324 RepID=UPI00145ED9E9|nr:hypothetical protein [Bifidobacterium sp. DSM 109959]